MTAAYNLGVTHAQSARYENEQRNPYDRRSLAWHCYNCGYNDNHRKLPMPPEPGEQMQLFSHSQ